MKPVVVEEAGGALELRAEPVGVEEAGGALEIRAELVGVEEAGGAPENETQHIFVLMKVCSAKQFPVSHIVLKKTS